MTREDAENRVKTISECGHEDLAETLTYELWNDVLLAIANGAENPSALAEQTMFAKEIWCDD